jgi:hypothetical protein
MIYDTVRDAGCSPQIAWVRVRRSTASSW